LIDALRDNHPTIRRAACTALGQIGDTAAVPVLIQRLEDTDSNVRSAACTALGQIGDAAAIPALKVHAEIMEEAQQALAMLGGTSMALQEAVRTLAEQSQWGVLCRALTSDQVRDAIVQLGSSAVPALIDALRDDDTEIRQAACTALGQIRDKAPVPSLIARLKDTNRDVRIAACTALGQIRDSSAVPALISTLYDKEVDVRIAATDALVNIGEAAIPALQEAITSGDPTIRKKVSGILNIIKQRTQR
jgi:HEAT repeat protein